MCSSAHEDSKRQNFRKTNKNWRRGRYHGYASLTTDMYVA